MQRIQSFAFTEANIAATAGIRCAYSRRYSLARRLGNTGER
jgi:hypothetical protein